MATSLTTTITVSGSEKIVQASITSDQIPVDVFIYENTGTTTLGVYVGVVNFQDYARIRTWDGSARPILGNKFVKHTIANFTRPLETSHISITNKLEADLGTFKSEYLTQGAITKTSVI